MSSSSKEMIKGKGKKQKCQRNNVENLRIYRDMIFFFRYDSSCWGSSTNSKVDT